MNYLPFYLNLEINWPRQCVIECLHHQEMCDVIVTADEVVNQIDVSIANKG